MSNGEEQTIEKKTAGFGQWGAHPRLSVLAPMFALQLITLLIYSGCITVFQSCDTLSNFIGTMANVSLVTAAVVAIACIAFVLRGRTLSSRVLDVTAVITYAVSCAGFLFLIATGSQSVSLVIVISVIAGIGDVLLAAVWGRLLMRFDLRAALLNLSISCILAAAGEKALMLVSKDMLLLLFGLAVLAVVIFILVYHPLHENEEPESQPIAISSVSATLRGVGAVALAPILGLVAFGFSMGVMRIDFLNVFGTYLLAVCVSGALFLILCLVRFEHRSAPHLIYQLLLPGLAIVVLAAGNILAMQTQSAASGFFDYLLYASVALVSLATCAAIAHAREFPSDLVFMVVIGLFALFSFVGQRVSAVVLDTTVTTIITVVIVLYALALGVLPSLQRWLDSDPGASKAESTSGRSDDGAVPVADYETGLDTTCMKLAGECGLTNRETEILRYLARGYSGSSIASTLFISNNTIRTHIHNIYGKMDVSSREDLIILVQRELREGDPVSGR